jgi:hypothetical protein
MCRIIPCERESANTATQKPKRKTLNRDYVAMKRTISILLCLPASWVPLFERELAQSSASHLHRTPAQATCTKPHKPSLKLVHSASLQVIALAHESHPSLILAWTPRPSSQLSSRLNAPCVRHMLKWPETHRHRFLETNAHQVCMKVTDPVGLFVSLSYIPSGL